MYGCNVPLEDKEIDKCKCVACLSKRIDELEKENWKSGSLLANLQSSVSFLTKENDQLHANVNELIDKIAEIANFYYKEKKSSYKCLACGCNVVLNTLNYHVCNGKGIVWD